MSTNARKVNGAWMSLFNLVQVILLNFLGGRIGSNPLTKNQIGAAAHSQQLRLPHQQAPHPVSSRSKRVGSWMFVMLELSRSLSTHPIVFHVSIPRWTLSYPMTSSMPMSCPTALSLGRLQLVSMVTWRSLQTSPNIAKEGLLGKAIALQADPEQSSNKFPQGKKSSNSLNTPSGVKFDYIALLNRIATHPAWSDSASAFNLLQTALVPFVINHYQPCSFVTAIIIINTSIYIYIYIYVMYVI